MIAHNTRPRNPSSLYLFIIFGVVLLTAAFIFVRLSASLQDNTISAAKPKLQTYQSSRYGFSIGYPHNWQVFSAPTGGNVFTFSSFALQTQVGGAGLSGQSTTTAAVPSQFSKIDVVAYDVTAGTTAQNLESQSTGFVMEGAVTDIAVDGQDAIKIDEPLSNQLVMGNESSLNYTSIFVTKGTRGFIIAGYAEPSLFNQIISSFHFN